MILPKVQKPTKADETTAYELATLRDNDICQRCRRHCGPSQRDHRKGRGVGGLTTAGNLQLLGGLNGCHLWKTDNAAEALAEGWTVPGYADPLEWPARRWLKSAYGLRLAWVLYDDQGGVTEITESDRLERMGLVQDMTEQRDRNG